MGFDQPVLHWLFDVVMITGFTSLAVICHGLKQDKKKLTIALAHTQLRKELSEIAMTPSAAPGSMPGQNTEPKASQSEQQDIRHFVARRSHDWFALAH